MSDASTFESVAEWIAVMKWRDKDRTTLRPELQGKWVGVVGTCIDKLEDFRADHLDLPAPWVVDDVEGEDANRNKPAEFADSTKDGDSHEAKDRESNATDEHKQPPPPPQQQQKRPVTPAEVDAMAASLGVDSVGYTSVKNGQGISEAWDQAISRAYHHLKSNSPTLLYPYACSPTQPLPTCTIL